MGTIGIEVHEWRGFECDRDLFLRYQRVGFVTICWSNNLLTDSLRKIERAMEQDPHAEPHGEVVQVPKK